MDARSIPTDATVTSLLAGYVWAESPFGPRERWPQSLATAAGICLESRFPIIIFWGEELLQFYNDAYCPILGERHPKAFGQRASECWHDIWTQVGPMLNMVLHDGQSTWSEDLLLPIETDGISCERYFTFSYSPIREGKGVTGVFCAVTETTAKVLGARDALQRAEQLAELSRLKTEFFNNVSHEFRTPLMLMLGPLEAAMELAGEERMRLELATAHRNAVRLRKLIDTLLTFSRLEAGQETPQLEPVDLRRVTLDLAAAFRFYVESAGLRFEVDCYAPEQTVLVDTAMWERIVFNLLSNAIKFTFEGSIRLSQRVETGYVVLEIADTGVGIPQSELPNLFKRFHRVQTTRARTQEGTGIGLALVNDLVNLHQGSIEVRSELGVGTTFEVRVRMRVAQASPIERPASHVAEPFLADVNSWLPAASDAFVPEMEAVGSELILVVDDNPDLRNYLERILSARWRVLSATDGAQALAVARREMPDLILTDVMMPVMDGLEFVKRIRADASTQHIPVIVLTARPDTGTQFAVTQMHADDYLAKPFTAPELVARVQARLDLAKLRMRIQRDETFLLEASRTLSSSIDAKATLVNLATVALPVRADWCRVDVFDADGTYATVAIAHADPQKNALAETFLSTSILATDGGASQRVARSGHSELFSDVPESLIASSLADEAVRAFYRKLGTRSALVVPLTARGRTLGALSLFYGDSNKTYSEADVPVIEEVARRAAMAYDNALLYDEEREHSSRVTEIVQRLQVMFLPQALPTLREFRFDAIYRPAEFDISIGGDWYAALRVDETWTLFGIGDVAGHGLDAAVAMGRCRQSILTVAPSVEHDPAEVLQRVNRILYLQHSLVTACVGFLNNTSGELIYASAGHPPALVRAANGQVRPLSLGGTMLGLLEQADFASHRDRLETGDTLVLYTDGLTEIGRNILEGERTLAQAVADGGFAESADPAHWLVERIVGTRPPADDIAVMTIHRADL